MKKLILSAIAATMLFASCKKEEIKIDDTVAVGIECVSCVLIVQNNLGSETVIPVKDVAVYGLKKPYSDSLTISVYTDASIGLVQNVVTTVLSGGKELDKRSSIGQAIGITYKVKIK